MKRSLASAAAATARLRATPRWPLASFSAASRPASITRDSSRSSSAVRRGTLPMSFRYRPMESFMVLWFNRSWRDSLGSGPVLCRRHSSVPSRDRFGAGGRLRMTCVPGLGCGGHSRVPGMSRGSNAPRPASAPRRLRRRAAAGSPTVVDPVDLTPRAGVEQRRIGLFGGTFDPPARRPPRHGGQRPPRPRPRRRRADGRQRPVAEGGQPADHAGARPPGDGRGGRRRRPGPGGRPAGDRPRRAELHRRHAGRDWPSGSPAPSCSPSSATTPPPG